MKHKHGKPIHPHHMAVHNVPTATDHHDGTQLGQNAPGPASYKQSQDYSMSPDYGMDPNEGMF